MAARTPTNQPFVADAIAILAPSDEGQPLRAERIDVIIEGEPQVQERPRMSNIGGMHMYDPNSLIKVKFRAAVKKTFDDLKFTYPLFQVALKIQVTFHISNMAKDVDNLLKFVLDALQTIVYNDDRSVQKITAEKHHSPDRGYTTIAVEPFNIIHIIE